MALMAHGMCLALHDLEQAAVDVLPGHLVPNQGN